MASSRSPRPLRRAAWRAGLGLVWLAVILTWAWRHLPDLSEGGAAEILLALGNLLGLLAGPLLVLQVWLGSREPWLVRDFSPGALLGLHRALGPWLLGALLSHALLHICRLGLLLGWETAAASLLSPAPWEMAAGKLGLLLLLAAGGAAWLGTRGRLAPRRWRPLHRLAYPAVALGLIHARFRGADFDLPWLAALWTGLGLALAWALLRRLGRGSG